ncbi:MAG TPA: hypothetical protein PLM32_13235 [Candidatus Competibacter sp.]|nr:hypothetical protein [Candidatus Competibacter sp.]
MDAALSLQPSNRAIRRGEAFGGTNRDHATLFDPHRADGYRERLPGIRQKTRDFGAKTLLAEFVLARRGNSPRSTDTPGWGNRASSSPSLPR